MIRCTRHLLLSLQSVRPVIGVVVEVPDSVNTPRMIRDLTEISFRSRFQTLATEQFASDKESRVFIS